MSAPQPPPVPTGALQDEIRFYGPDLVQDFIAHLLAQRRVSEEQVAEVQNRASLTGQPVDRLLLEESIIDEQTYLEAYSAISGIPIRKIGDYKIEATIMERVSARLALRHRVVPVAFSEGLLTLAVSRVPPSVTVEGLRMVLETPLAFILCNDSDVSRSLTHFYGLGAETVRS